MNQPIQTAAYWDETADGYIASAEPFTALFCEDAVQLADVKPGLTLLDIATGPGALALAAANAGAKVTAIDFSQEMIARLSKRSAGKDIKALQMDGQALDLPSSHFDRVCSVFGVPLFADWRAGLTEMVRVLRPGGRAVLGVAANPYGFGPNHLFAEARRALWPDQDINMGLSGMAPLSDADHLKTVLQDTGLDEVALHKRTHDIVMDRGLITANNPMVSANPLISKLSSIQRDAVIEKALQIAEQWRSGDNIQMPGTAYLATATK